MNKLMRFRMDNHLRIAIEFLVYGGVAGLISIVSHYNMIHGDRLMSLLFFVSEAVLFAIAMYSLANFGLYLVYKYPALAGVAHRISGGKLGYEEEN